MVEKNLCRVMQQEQQPKCPEQIRYCRCVESLEAEHRPNPLFDAAMILLHHIVQVLAGPYPNPARYRSH